MLYSTIIAHLFAVLKHLKLFPMEFRIEMCDYWGEFCFVEAVKETNTEVTGAL